MKYDSITEIINQWDPINLLSHAPLDEYKHEIHLIRELLKTNVNTKELGKGIQNIFIKQFGKDIFKKKYEDCLLIAQKLQKVK